MVDKKENKRIQKLKQKARNLSIKEGIFASANNSFGIQYLSPFAIAINASNSVVALLSSIAGLLGPLAQLFISRLIGKFSRKKIILKAVLIESFLWLFFILIAFLFSKNVITTMLPVLLLFVFSLHTIFLNTTHPAWFSWIGDIVSERYRGRWISKRRFLTGFAALIFAIGAALFLEYMKKNNLPMLGFIILFFLAFLTRIECWRIFKIKYEPEIKLNKGTYFSFFDFLIKAPKNNFGKFAIFRFFFAFSITISTSLLAVYLLRYLNFNYFDYILIIFSATIFSLLVTEVWGKIADKYGNYKVLVITTILIPLIPIFWVLYDSIIYLILVPGIIRGVSWAGFNISAGNFIYDNVSSEKRGLAVSYYNMLRGLGIFLGGLVGAFLITFLKIEFTEPIILIFFISALLSMVVVFFGIPLIKEIKKGMGPNPKVKVFRRFIMHEIRPTLVNEMHEIGALKKYLKQK